MTARPFVVLLTVMAALALAVGCGGVSAKQKAARRKAQVSVLADGVRERERAREEDRAATRHSDCVDSIGSFLDTLHQLDSDLDDGLSYYEYSSEVDDVSSAYEGVGVSSLGSECLVPAASAVKAANAYRRAFKTWDDCYTDVFCDDDSIDPQLQDDWSRATTLVARAETALENLAAPDLTKVGAWTQDIPENATAVDSTVYGAASQELCSGGEPAAARDPCSTLRKILAGGVQSSEVDDLDEAVEEINLAFGFAK